MHDRVPPDVNVLKVWERDEAIVEIVDIGEASIHWGFELNCVFLTNTHVTFEISWPDNILRTKAVPPNTIAFLPCSEDVTARYLAPCSITLIKQRHPVYSFIGDEVLRIIPYSNDGVGSKIAQAIRKLAIDNDGCRPGLVRALNLALAVRMVELSIERGVPPAPPLKGLSMSRRSKVLHFIESNLHRPIGLADMAKCVSLSESHFCRLFTADGGLTPMRYLTARRVAKAETLIKDNDVVRLAQVAIECGFSSQSHMTTAFKRETGLTPGEFRARMLKTRKSQP